VRYNIIVSDNDGNRCVGHRGNLEDATELAHLWLTKYQVVYVKREDSVNPLRTLVREGGWDR